MEEEINSFSIEFLEFIDMSVNLGPDLDLNWQVLVKSCLSTWTSFKL